MKLIIHLVLGTPKNCCIMKVFEYLVKFSLKASA